MSTPAHLRKAAILVAGLDRQTADEVLGQLPAAEASLVRTAVLELDSFDQREQDEIIADFLQREDELPRSAHDGPSQDEASVTLELTGVSRAGAPANPSTSPQAATRGVLDDLPTDTLVSFLLREQPQTVAVVLSRLSPQRAAKVMAGLPPALKSDVIRRLVELDPSNEEVVQEVQFLLQTLLKDESTNQRQRFAGIAAVNSIISAAESSQRDHILSSLAEVDVDLAARLGYVAEHRKLTDQPDQAEAGPAKSFSTRCRAEPDAPRMSANRQHESMAGICASSQIDSEHGAIDIPGLETLNRSTETTLVGVISRNPEIAITALAGATRRLQNAILGRLPNELARRIRRNLQRLGPVRIDDIQCAQHELIRLARRASE